MVAIHESIGSAVRQRKFNRAENVRQIPPGDPDFETLYKRRNDAESINRHLDDTLWLRRAHSVGWRRQLLNCARVVGRSRASAPALDADALLLLTDVAAVETADGEPRSEPIRSASVAELRADAFPPGSMGPKVEAASRFAAGGGVVASTRSSRQRRSSPAAPEPE